MNFSRRTDGRQHSEMVCFHDRVQTVYFGLRRDLGVLYGSSIGVELLLGHDDAVKPVHCPRFL